MPKSTMVIEMHFFHPVWSLTECSHDLQYSEKSNHGSGGPAMFNLWIYQRRPACSARMQHGGSASVQPQEEFGIETAEESEARMAVNSGQAGSVENKVLPFRSPLDAAPRDGILRTDRKSRGRSKGRSKS